LGAVQCRLPNGMFNTPSLNSKNLNIDAANGSINDLLLRC
jgi:hypothetical protein